jgi:hypothetical protein
MENGRIGPGLEEQARDAVVAAHVAQGDRRIVAVVGLEPKGVGVRGLVEGDRKRRGAPSGRLTPASLAEPAAGDVTAVVLDVLEQPHVALKQRRGHRGREARERQSRTGQRDSPAAELGLFRIGGWMIKVRKSALVTADTVKSGQCFLPEMLFFIFRPSTQHFNP